MNICPKCNQEKPRARSDERICQECLTEYYRVGRIEKRERTNGLHTKWNGIKTRCAHPVATGYKYYGGRGIRVCNEWFYSFAAFSKWSLSNGYERHLTIDRIDSDGDYEPENCRWITISENVREMLIRRGKRMLSADDILSIVRMRADRKTYGEIAASFSVSYGVIYSVISGKTYRDLPRVAL